MSLIVPHVEELVSTTHAYRRLVKVVDWRQLTKPLEKLYSELGRGGYPVAQGFRCLLLGIVEKVLSVGGRRPEAVPQVGFYRYEDVKTTHEATSDQACPSCEGRNPETVTI
jgi:hypothetical protein